MRILWFGRNADARSIDDASEMTWFERLDDGAVDVLLSGSVPRGGDDLTDVALFAQALADAAVASPRPSGELAELLVDGLSPAKFDAVASSAKRQPNKRKRTVLETALAKLTSLGLAAKTSVAGATVLATMTIGAGAAGALPAPVQETAADVVSAVSPFEIPRPDVAPADTGAPDDVRTSTDGDPAANDHGHDDVRTPSDGDPAANDHGQAVSHTARTTDAEGCERGHEIAEVGGGNPGDCVDGTDVERGEVPPNRGLTTAAERAADEAQQHLDAAAGHDAAAPDARQHGREGADAGQSGGDTAADASRRDQDNGEQGGDAAAAARP